jgi:hypothetical protein
VKDILSSIDQQTWGLCEKLNANIEEPQLGCNMQTKNLCEVLDAEILEARINIQTTKTLVESTRHELMTRLVEFEAQAQHGCGRSTGTDIGRDTRV